MKEERLWILTADEVVNTASRADGIEEDVENRLRVFGCELMQEAGILLRLPQYTVATGQVLFHRFYFRHSMKEYDVWDVARASLFLAAKAEETPKKKIDVMNVFEHILQTRNRLEKKPVDVHSKGYSDLKECLIKYEREILKCLGFVLNVEHPHKFILTYLKTLDLASNEELAQKAWNYTNDSYRTVACLRFPADRIAVATIQMAAEDLGIALPVDPPWWSVFDATKEDIDAVSAMVRSLYDLPKAAYIPVCPAAAARYKCDLPEVEEDGDAAVEMEVSAEAAPVGGADA